MFYSDGIFQSVTDPDELVSSAEADVIFQVCLWTLLLLQMWQNPDLS